MERPALSQYCFAERARVSSSRGRLEGWHENGSGHKQGCQRRIRESLKVRSQRHSPHASVWSVGQELGQSKREDLVPEVRPRTVAEGHFPHWSSYWYLKRGRIRSSSNFGEQVRTAQNGSCQLQVPGVYVVDVLQGRQGQLVQRVFHLAHISNW